MAALGEDQMALLMRTLESDFVPHLPALLENTNTATQQQHKDLYRAFSTLTFAKFTGSPVIWLSNKRERNGRQDSRTPKIYSPVFSPKRRRLGTSHEH
jgi:hypothetical protein